MTGSVTSGFGYYYNSSVHSGATLAAGRTAMSAVNSGLPVDAVDSVPEVYSNDETERIQHSPEQVEKERFDAFESMRYAASRSIEHLEAPSRFFDNTSGADSTKQTEANHEKKAGRASSPEECETCENRTYVDGSNEANVSFKTPGHISPEASYSMVSAHEQEHVANARAEGNKKGSELVSASVTLRTAVCPECGTPYVAGGTTRTVIRHGTENPYEKMQNDFSDFANGKRGNVDVAA